MTFYQLRAINADGSSPSGGGVLSDFEKLSLGIIFSDVGSLTFDYATNGINASLVTEQREVAVYDHLGEIPDGRFVIESSNGQRWDTGTGTLYRSWTARSWWKVFEEALVYGVNWPTNKAEAVRPFATQTPGAILKTVIDKAQSLGEMTGLTYTFTNTLDSAGIAWAGTTTMDVETDTTILNLITSMVENGLVEIRMVGRELRAYNPNGLGTDRTLGSTPLSLWSVNSIELPEQRDSRGLRTVAIVRGDNGACVEVVNAGAVATWGRRPLVVSQSGVVDAGALTAIGTAALAQAAQVRSERSVKYPVIIGTTPIPLRDYIAGDWVYNDMSGTPDRVRVRQLTIEQDSSEAPPTVIGTLNDLFLEAEIALARQIAGITGGARLDSTPPAEGPVTLDTLAPAQVLGLTGTSTAYVDIQARTWTFVTLNWNAVTTNSDTTSITDLDRYEIFLKKQADTNYSQVMSTINTSAIIDGLLPNVTYNFQVRAVDKNNNAGLFSSAFTLTTANDTTAPPIPKTPVVQDYLGQVRIYWDGLGSAGEAMPGDFKWTEVHISTVSGFTPSTATLIDQMTSAGYALMSDLTYDTPYFVKFISVDRIGNKSAASAQATATPTRVSGLDVAALAIATSNLGDLAVTTAKMADLSVINAKIANLAVDDAKIGSVSAGKITVGTLIADITVSARIKTANTGPRVELSNLGLLAFNTAGQQTVTVSAATGNVSILGDFKTGVAGGGTAYLSIDDSIDRSTISFWNAAGTKNAFINSPVGASAPQMGLNTGSYTITGATAGYSRLFLRDGAGIGLETVRASDQTPFGGAIFLDSSSGRIRFSPLGGASSGGEVYVDVNGVQITRNTAGVSNTAGRLKAEESAAVLEFTTAAGASDQGIIADATSLRTFGTQGSSISWSAVEGPNVTLSEFRMEKFGGIVTVHCFFTVFNAIAAGNITDQTIVTITSTGGLPASQTSCAMQHAAGVGAVSLDSAGTMLLRWMSTAMAVGETFRVDVAYWHA